jgi:hypothetical protein
VFIEGQAFEPTEDIEQHTANPSPETNKLLRNGQLIIERNGKMYNVLGTRLH